MKPFPAAALVILFIAATAIPCFASDCQGSISQMVPAVMGEGGGLVNTTVSLAPGPGNAYAGVWPRTATSTQESIDDAVGYAYSLSGHGPCDVLVMFSVPGAADYVEGPSAGAALAVMTYALLENRSLRQDAIMTGTIDSGGGIGEVGGLYEKARGAAFAGARYFITPVEGLYERMLLASVEREYGMTVLQARNAGEVISFMMDGVPISQEGFVVRNRPMPDLPPYPGGGLERFAPVALEMIALEKQAANALGTGTLASGTPATAAEQQAGTGPTGAGRPAGAGTGNATQRDAGNATQGQDGRGMDNDTSLARDFFLNEAKRQERLLELGYAFSAANEAFLDYIEVSSIGAMTGGGDPDLPRKKGEAGICLSRITRPVMTDANFEWVVGSELREGWAELRLNLTGTEGRMTSDEKFAAYNDLMYAQAWCSVSGGLAAAAPAGGTPVDEGTLKELADAKLGEARSLQLSSADTKFKMDAATASYAKGRYGAAIYDALYVIAIDGAAHAGGEAGENRSTGKAAAKDAAAKLLNESRTSLWGRIYRSQGAYLYAQNDSAGALTILGFAKALDGATNEMRVALGTGNATQGQDGSGMAREWTDHGNILPAGAAYTLAAAGILIFLLVIVLMIVRGTHPKGTRKAAGAKQKEGRA